MKVGAAEESRILYGAITAAVIALSFEYFAGLVTMLLSDNSQEFEQFVRREISVDALSAEIGK
jgi:hypothetical protein